MEQMPIKHAKKFLHSGCFQEPFWNTQYIQDLTTPKQGKSEITLHKTCTNHQIIESLLSFLPSLLFDKKFGNQIVRQQQLELQQL